MFFYPTNFSRMSREVSGFLCLFLLLSCGGGTKAPDWAKCDNANTSPDVTYTNGTSNNKKAETPKNKINTSNYLVVYLDVSGSMPGYVSPYKNIPYGSLEDGKTIFSQTLLELRDIVISLDSRIILRKMSNEISPPSLNEVELAQASVDRSLFNALETNIAAALDTFDDPLTQQDNIPRFHILITDGVQSVKDENNSSSQNISNPCAIRSDYHCVRARIKNLLNNGWSGTILGIKSEFNGKIPSELKPPQGIEYDWKKSPERLRPFYLYIFSPDGEGLSNFVKTLKKKLEFLSEKAKLPNAVREYPLSMKLTDGTINSEASVPIEIRNQLTVKKEQKENISRFTIDNDVPKRKTGSFTVTLDIPWSEHAKSIGNWRELKTFLKHKLEKLNCIPENENECISELKEKSFDIDDTGKIIAVFETAWQDKPGREVWRLYRWTINFDTSQNLPPWMSEWSTNDDLYDANGNRTLNLTSTMSGLWNNAAMENQIIGEVQFRVGNE